MIDLDGGAGNSPDRRREHGKVPVMTQRGRMLRGVAIALVAVFLPVCAISYEDEGGVTFYGTVGETSACTLGVTVKTKSGSIEKGYIMWSKDDPNGPDLEELLKHLLHKGVHTDRYRPLHLMGRIRKIKYPSPMYAAVKEDVRSIDALDIESVSRDPALDLRIPLPIMHLPLRSVETLAKVKPRFTVVVPQEGMDTLFIVCGSNVGVEGLVAYLASRFRMWKKLEGCAVTLSVDGKDIWMWSTYRGAEVLGKDSAYAPLIRSFSRIEAIIESTRLRDEKALAPCGDLDYPRFPDGCVDRKCQDEVLRKWNECRERIRRSLFVPAGKAGAVAPVWGRDIVVYYSAYD